MAQQASERTLPLKDQPIDIDEFERLWDEIEYHWRNVQFLEHPDLRPLSRDNNKLYNNSRRSLRDIKYRFFNQILL